MTLDSGRGFSKAMPVCNDPRYVIAKLAWMRAQSIWPNGLRYLWTDAFGLVLLVSLYTELGKRRYLDEAESLVAEVVRVLGRPRGIRIGEASDRDGQYFHYLAMWLYGLYILGRHISDYRRMGVDLVRQVHDAFVLPRRGVIWKMREDLSGPYPGYGLVPRLGDFDQLEVKILTGAISSQDGQGFWGKEQRDAARRARDTTNESETFEGEDHLMHGGCGDLEVFWKSRSAGGLRLS